MLSANNPESTETSGQDLPVHPNKSAVDTEKLIITDEMVKEEERIQKSASDQFQREIYEMRQREFNDDQKAQRQKRLNFLIERAGVYSNWLAEKLETRQKEQREEAERLELEAALNPESQSTETNIVPSHRETVDPLTSFSEDSPEDLQDEDFTASRNGKPTKKSKKRAAASHSKGKKRVKQDYDYLEPEQLIPVVKRTQRQPTLITGCTMREYQLVGMEWLISLYDNGLNGILADEMGLGKTLQTIAFLAHLREMGTPGPFLVVAPLSTLGNWVSEIERFAPSIPAILYHGPPAQRASIRNKQMKFKNNNFPIIVTSYEIAMNDRKHLQHIMWKFIVVDEGHRIKNLNCRLIRELKSYHSANRLLLTGTPLQNNLSELWSLLNFLMPDIFDDLGAFEEWFDFANDLGNQDDDSEKKIDSSQGGFVSQLHQILKPFLLRRIKSEVASDLPKKREYILYAPMVPKQRELYNAALKGGLREYLTDKLTVSTESFESGDSLDFDASKEYINSNPVSEEPIQESLVASDSTTASAEASEATDAVISTPNFNEDRRSSRVNMKKEYKEKGEDDISAQEPVFYSIPMDKKPKDNSKLVAKAVGALKLQSLITQLRKVCNHPYLFDIEEDAEEELMEHAKKEHIPKDLLVSESTAMPNIVSWSGKMILLDRLLTSLLDRGHKVLIFSQMTRVLDIIGDWLEYIKKLKFCRIDGSVKMDDRKIEINNFNTESETKVFLLSTRAGGLGLNLTAADTVIIFDSDWNPQADIQAQDRVHRIGQTKNVIVYRFVTANSVEAKILKTAGAKRTLEKLVIHKGHFKGNKNYYKSNNLTDISELEEILKTDDTLRVGSSTEAGGCDVTPETVLSDADLELILDRSEEAYILRKSGKFEIVQETRDETMDAIANGIPTD